MNSSIVIEKCSTCFKPPELCCCQAIKPVANRIHVLVLQHPQEKKEVLGTAPLIRSTLTQCTLKAGLSWPNVQKALGRTIDASRWGVLYLGGAKEELPKQDFNKTQILITDRKGTVVSPQKAGLQGIVVLDGTWAQAKTLWWRNPWLLKLRRVRIVPKKRSLFGMLRKEPRRECLSTLESVAETLEALGENAKAPQSLMSNFEMFLTKVKQQRSAPAKPAAEETKPTTA